MRTIFKSLIFFLACWIVWIPPTQVAAQLSESEMNQYVPATGFLFLSLNMESVLGQVDMEHVTLKKFRERDRAAPTDFFHTSRLLYVLGSDEETVDEFEFPVVALTRYKDAVDQKAYEKHLNAQAFQAYTYEAETYKDHKLFVGKLVDRQDGTIHMTTSMPTFFFPSDDLVVMGTGTFPKSLVDGLDDDSPGKTLAGNLNSEADLHLLMGKGSNITSKSFFGAMTREMSIPGYDLGEILDSIESLEVIGDADQMTPILGTIELDSSEAAETLEELIRTGLQAVPGLLMLAESELKVAIERDSGEISNIKDEVELLIKLAKSAASELEVTRNDSTLELQLGATEGLDKFIQAIIVVIAVQQMEMEKFMAEIQGMDGGRIELGDGMIELDDDDGRE